jgi:hypothetical protein
MGFLQDVFGGRPKYQRWQDVSLDKSQQGAIDANLAALPGMEKLAEGVNVFNQEQLTQLLNSVMPGWSDMTKQAGKNIASELKGEIPTDVAQALQSSDAAKALTGGFGGSGLAGNLTARDLGITSLNLMQQGQSSLESWSAMIDQMFAPGMMNVGSMFISPQQEFESLFKNQMGKFGQSNMMAGAAAMPDPVTGALVNMGQGAAKGVMTALSALLI